MAKPRIFVSSTYYDLKHIRRSVEQFIESLGYEATVFESGDIPFSPDTPLDESCYREIGLCHILVLIIGGRYGSAASSENRNTSAIDINKQYEHYNSVTKKEYEKARDQEIPIYIFVEKGVLAEYETYKHNRDKEVKYAHVDSVNIFKLLEDILSQSRNNFVREFSTADDITSWLRDQWAGLLSLFITQRQDGATVGQIKAQIDSLTSVVGALKTYSEQVLRSVSKGESENLINKVDEEIRQNKIVAQLNSSPTLSLLMDRYDIPKDSLLEAISESENLANLSDKINHLMLNHTGMITSMSQVVLWSERDPINEIREILGKAPIGLSATPPP